MNTIHTGQYVKNVSIKYLETMKRYKKILFWLSVTILSLSLAMLLYAIIDLIIQLL